jgi:hypothetical protein
MRWIFVCVLFLAGCGGTETQPTATPTTPTTPASYTVEYRVTGTPSGIRDTAYASLMWSNSTGGMERDEAVIVPSWSQQYTMPHGAWATLTVGNSRNLWAETIRCEIRVNGSTWRSQEASGRNSSVTCSGFVGR